MDKAMMEDAQEEGQENAGEGIVIEITCKSDGTFVVSSEPMQMEAQEENAMGGEESGENEITATSIGEALKIALSIYRDKAPTQSNAQQQFAAGYGKR